MASRVWDVGRGGGKNWKQIQSGEDEKEKEEEERLHIHIWWCGGFHGMVHGYGDTWVQRYKVAGAQGCQDLVGARHTHGTYLGQHRASQQKSTYSST